MKIKILTTNLLTFLLLLPSILSFGEGSVAQSTVEIKREDTESSETETIPKPTPDEIKTIILQQSRANSEAQRKARKFFEEYPYETSRIIFFCRRTASAKVGFFVSANGNYANEFIVQEYFRTDKPLLPTISDSLMININSQINILSQLSEDIIQQKVSNDSNIREIDQKIQAVINSLTEVSVQYSWSRKALLAQIEELSKIRSNLVIQPSINISKSILSVTNKLRRLQSLTAINGVGMRVIAEINSLDGTIRTGSLISILSLDVNGTKISGNISTEVFGLGGRFISDAVNISTDLSLGNALRAQESIFRVREALITHSGSNINPIDITLSPVPIPPINLENRLCSNANN
jgi:hypothetical protein